MIDPTCRTHLFEKPPVPVAVQRTRLIKRTCPRLRCQVQHRTGPVQSRGLDPNPIDLRARTHGVSSAVHLIYTLEDDPIDPETHWLVEANTQTQGARTDPGLC